jgi:hypothetical protein
VSCSSSLGRAGIELGTAGQCNWDCWSVHSCHLYAVSPEFLWLLHVAVAYLLTCACLSACRCWHTCVA